MSVPNLTPRSQVSAITLPATGSYNRVAGNLPFGIYANDTNFISGAVDQVAFTYKMLGGDVLDIELTEYNVYAAYEAAILEYSYIINLHQAKNVLPSVLGNVTGTFNQDGELTGQLSSSLGGLGFELRYPAFNVGFIKQISNWAGEETGVGGNLRHFSASIDIVPGRQEYDIQEIIQNSSAQGGVDWANQVQNKKITIRRVYYKTPRAMWRFYGYGGLNAVGNLSSYGQWADDSTFEVIPAWHNKLQAMAYEDNIWTRVSHFSYEIKNNRIKLFPPPESTTFSLANRKMWIEFTIPQEDAFEATDLMNGGSSVGAAAGIKTGIGGINNMNTLPFANIPYQNINSIGKQWIRRYALAMAKEVLGQIRSKFNVVPIPGENITLNGDNLLNQAKDEQDKLKEELKTILSELTYAELAKQTTDLSDAAQNVLSKTPMVIFVG